MKKYRIYNVQQKVGELQERTSGVIVSAKNHRDAKWIVATEYGYCMENLRANPISPLKDKILFNYVSGDVI